MINLDYLYHPDAGKVLLNRNYFVDKKLGFQIIEHGIVLPSNHMSTTPGKFASGVITSNGEHIQGTFVHRGTDITHIPPPNQFNIVLKLLFT